MAKYYYEKRYINTTYYWDRYNINKTYRWDKYNANSVYTSGSFAYQNTYNDTSYGGSSGYSFNSSTGNYSTTGGTSFYNTTSTTSVYSGGGSSITRYRGNGQGTGYHRDVASSSFSHYTMGSYVGMVTSSNSSAYPSSGVSGGYWYSAQGYTESAGSYVGSTSSSSSSAYPSNGTSGSYWYSSSGSSNSSGSLIATIVAEDGTYPTNGTSGGYWYIRKELAFNPLTNLVLPYPNDFKRKENLEYLRTKANEFRTANSLPEKVWAEPVIISGVTPIKADHWNEVQTAINEVYTSVGQTYRTPVVEDYIKTTIQARVRKYPISELDDRMDKILLALMDA